MPFLTAPFGWSVIVEPERRAGERLRPAAPFPHNRKLSTLQVLRELGRNPVAAFGIHGYSERYIHSRTFVQDFLMVNDPEGIKHVLLDNAANYVKSIQAQRLTKPALGNGLVTSEGASWRFQRRTIAPMFSPRHIAEFASVMEDAAGKMIERWSVLPEGAEIDAADEMMRLTYEIISRTLFSNDVTMQYGRMSEALAVYLETQGRIDILRTHGPARLGADAEQSARPRAAQVLPQGIARAYRAAPRAACGRSGRRPPRFPDHAADHPRSRGRRRCSARRRSSTM